MFERVQNVRSWSGLSIMQEAEFGDVDKRLSIFLRELNDSYAGIYAEISVIDSRGLVIASSDPAQIGKLTVLSQPWIVIEEPAPTVHFLQLVGQRLPITTTIKNTSSTLTLVAQFNWQNIETLLKPGYMSTLAVSDTSLFLIWI